MLYQLTALLPSELLRLSAGATVMCAVAGIALWLVGARFSRYLVTLAAVAVGTVVGMRLPTWMGWQVDGMGTAVAGAIVIGVGGFLLHRTWIGLLLGLMMALWVGLAVWVAMAGDVQWDWHAVEWSGQPVQFMKNVWQTFPPNLSRIVPIAMMTGFGAGTLLAVFWPKLSKVLAFTLIGVTVAVPMGLVATRDVHPQWLSLVPSAVPAQVALLAGLVVLGSIIQWRNTPPRGGPKPAGKKDAQPATA